MHTAADIRADAVPRLFGLVEREKRATGSLMLAYTDVGRTIGASASWVRKVLRGDPATLHAHVIANIKARYDEACERLEHEAAIERERFLALGRVTDAVATGADRSGGLAQGSDDARSGQAPAVVAPLVDASRERLTDDPAAPASWRGVRR